MPTITCSCTLATPQGQLAATGRAGSNRVAKAEAAQKMLARLTELGLDAEAPTVPVDEGLPSIGGMPSGALNELCQRMGWPVPEETWEEERNDEDSSVFTCTLKLAVPKGETHGVLGALGQREERGTRLLAKSFSSYLSEAELGNNIAGHPELIVTTMRTGVGTR